jgi:predicted PurR-regulated permease PerM
VKGKNGTSRRFASGKNHLAKVFIAALLGLAFFKLAQFLEVVGLSILISIALRPIFLGVQRHKWPKWAAVALCAVILFEGWRSYPEY